MLKGLGCFKFSTSGFCIVTLVHGKDEGRDFYAFIAIDPENYKYFKKRYKAGEMSSFRTFGHELVRGWGMEPEDAVIDHLKERHGIEFGMTETFLTRFASNIEDTFAPLYGKQSAFGGSAWA